ncbi:hypothetical protein R3P38DRAFT_2791164 [Favolaschia claudopus]|uniref:Uncharacterized protein n=1 Tax=Favolaschia claudopus TaxID=2862362 RepID=A0AAW0AH64_9AGAR
MPHLRLVFAEARVVRPRPNAEHEEATTGTTADESDTASNSRSFQAQTIAVSPMANPRSSPPHKRSKKGNRDSEEPSPLKAHKEDPYEAEGFEPTRSISAQRRKVLVSSPQELPSFSPQWYKRFAPPGLRKLSSITWSRLRSSLTEAGTLPLTSSATLTIPRSSVIASDYRECSPSPRARQLACTHERFRGGFQGKVIPGIDSVAEEEVEFYTKLFKTARKESERDTKARKGSAMDEEEGEEVRVIAVEEAEAPREPSPMQEDAPEPAAATISLDDAIAADEAGRDEFVEGSSGGGT